MSETIETPAKRWTPEDKERPKEGTPIPKKRCCKRCGHDVPVNRLRLCYRCWVITMIEQRTPGWIPGMQHPDWCQCTLPEHQRTERKGGGRFN